MAAVSERAGWGELLYESLRRQQTAEHSARKASKTAYAEPAPYRMSPRTQHTGEQVEKRLLWVFRCGTMGHRWWQYSKVFLENLLKSLLHARHSVGHHARR